jgi:hypothetical protein
VLGGHRGTVREFGLPEGRHERLPSPGSRRGNAALFETWNKLQR